MTKQGGWPPTRFGSRLKQLREAAGLTQEALADKASCHKFTVAKLEQGLHEPAWPLVLALIRALGVSCEEFSKADQQPASEVPPNRPRGRPPKAARPAPDERTPDEQAKKPPEAKKPAGGKGRKRKGG